jgi:hypothetical protein
VLAARKSVPSSNERAPKRKAAGRKSDTFSMDAEEDLFAMDSEDDAFSMEVGLGAPIKIQAPQPKVRHGPVAVHLFPYL